MRRQPAPRRYFQGLGRTLAAVAAAAGLVAIPTAANATGTYLTVGTASAGTHAFFSMNTTPIEFDSLAAGADLDCGAGGVNGLLTAGVEVIPSNDIGSVQGMWLTPCLLNGMPVNVTATTPGTDITVTSNPSVAHSPFDVSIGGVELHVRSTGSTPYACEFLMAGALEAELRPGPSGGYGATLVADSLVETFDTIALDGSGTGTPSSSGTTCGGLIFTGDGWSLDAAYGLTSNGVITHD